MTLLRLEEYKTTAASRMSNYNTNTRNNHNLTAGNNESDLLDKLQDMVPFMPRGRELSKLEIINYVIDYIRQLKEMVVEEEEEERHHHHQQQQTRKM